MKTFRVLLLALIFSVQESEEYKIIITRQPRDKFTIPSFLCTSNWRDKCKDMGGTTTRTNHCTCKCTEGSKNVFGYFEKSWKCISNHDLRLNFSGCIYEHFYEENDNSSLKVVSLDKVRFGSYKYLGYLSKYCSLESQISYLNCHGEWKQFNVNSSMGFSFQGQMHSLYYRDKRHFEKYWPKVNGRIINLSLNCSANYNGEKQGGHCVLLKVEGRQNCKDTLLTISTSTTTIKLAQTSPSASFTTSSTTSSTAFSATSSTTATKLVQTSSTTSQTTLSSSFNKQTTLGQTSAFSTTSSATSSTTATKLVQTSSITSSTTSQTASSSSFNKQIITMKLGGISSITSYKTSKSSNEQTTPTVTAGKKITTVTLMKTSSYESTTASYTIIDISSPTGRVTKNTKSQTSDGVYTRFQQPNSPQEEESANTNDSSSATIIGGTVVGVIALVVIILIGVIIRKKRFSQAKRESTVAENPSYDYAIPMSPGRLQFPHNEYSYAYADNHPVAVREKNGRELGSRVVNIHNGNIEGFSGSPPNHSAPIYAKPNKPPRKRNVFSQGTQRATKQEPVYDVLEDPNSTLNTSPNTDGPTYDTLEDPNYAKPLKNACDVLSQKHEGTKTEDGPVYEGHKDPNSISAPIHSVLEGSNSNEQQQVNDALEYNDPHIYGSLDSPDPHIYGALYYPTTNVSSGYNNVLYGSINDTITLDTRQLGQLGLESSEQGFSKNVMAMKNMSGVN